MKFYEICFVMCSLMYVTGDCTRNGTSDTRICHIDADLLLCEQQAGISGHTVPWCTTDGDCGGWDDTPHTSSSFDLHSASSGASYVRPTSIGVEPSLNKGHLPPVFATFIIINRRLII